MFSLLFPQPFCFLLLRGRKGRFTGRFGAEAGLLYSTASWICFHCSRGLEEEQRMICWWSASLCCRGGRHGNLEGTARFTLQVCVHTVCGEDARLARLLLWLVLHGVFFPSLSASVISFLLIFLFLWCSFGVLLHKLLLVYHSASHQLTSSPELLVNLAQWQPNI